MNEALVREGYARVLAIKPDTARYGVLKEAQQEAREEGRGMWADDACAVEDSGNKSGFTAPLDRASQRMTKKPFGIFISPETSPVQPERFSGYHTGTDFEIFSGEGSASVEVRAICNGEIVRKQSVSGYGGVVVEACEYEGDPVTVLYGHVSLVGTEKSVGDTLQAGEVLSVLGDPSMGETDGERKHLHLGVHKGEAVDFHGYVSRKSDLGAWINPCILGVCNSL